MKDYIEHNGHKVTLSIALERKGAGFTSSMYVGHAMDMTTLINELDRVKIEFADIIRLGSSVVVDVQDYLPPEEAEEWGADQ